MKAMNIVWKSWLVFGALLAGCGGTGASDQDILSTKSSTQALWACNTKSSRVVCTAPVSDAAPKTPAYVCEDGQRGPSCPDDVSLEHTPGLRALLSDPGYAAFFSSKPWACLVTGKHQLQCAREVIPGGLAGRAGAGGSGGEGAGGEGGPAAGATSGGGGGAGASGGPSSGPPGANATGTPGGAGAVTNPAPPATCAAGAWEEYFAKLATYHYTTHGAPIQFPRDIFDGTQSMGVLGAQLASVPVTPGAPSCHDGE